MRNRIDIKNLEKNPDYQDYIQNRRPAEKARAEELRSRQRELNRKREMSEARIHYGKTLAQLDRHSDIKLNPDEVVFDVPDRQQILDLRNELERITRPEDAVKVFDKIVFGDDPNNRTIVDTEPKIEDERYIY